MTTPRKFFNLSHHKLSLFHGFLCSKIEKWSCNSLAQLYPTELKILYHNKAYLLISYRDVVLQFGVNAQSRLEMIIKNIVGISSYDTSFAHRGISNRNDFNSGCLLCLSIIWVHLFYYYIIQIPYSIKKVL